MLVTPRRIVAITVPVIVIMKAPPAAAIRVFDRQQFSIEHFQFAGNDLFGVNWRTEGMGHCFTSNSAAARNLFRYRID